MHLNNPIHHHKPNWDEYIAQFAIDIGSLDCDKILKLKSEFDVDENMRQLNFKILMFFLAQILTKTENESWSDRWL